MFKSAKGVSIIDQRLAAEMHKRQIETLVKSEGLARRLESSIDAASRQWLDILTSSADPQTKIYSSRKLWQILFRHLPSDVGDGFRRLMQWSHTEQVKIFAAVIPRHWFRKVSAEIATMNLEDAGRELPVARRVNVPGQLGAPGLQADVFTEPIADRDERMSDEEWQEVLTRFVFPPPDPIEVEQMFHARDFEGVNWQGRLERLSRRITDIDQMAQQIIMGFAEGENLQQLKRRALPLVEGIQASAKRIVRTEGLRLAEQVQRRSWTGLGDMMQGAQILAVLDQNTRPEHAARNGTIYYQDPSPGQRSMAELPILPDAFNCRCWSTPVLKPPKELEDDPEIAAAFRNASGAGIPDPASYDRWFATADRDRRIMAVGSRRYRAAEEMLAGIRDPEWTDFIDAEGQLLPVSTIRGESPAERAERKYEVGELIRRRGEQVQAIAARGFVLPGDVGPAAPRPATPPETPPVPPPRVDTPPPIVPPVVAPPAPPAPVPVPVPAPAVVQAEPPTPAPTPIQPRRKPPLAKSAKEAKQIVKDYDLADVADFTGLDVDVANDMIQGISDAVSDFPELRANLKFVGSSQARNKYLTAVHVERVKAHLADTLGRTPDKTVMDYAAKQIKKNIGRVPGDVYAYSTNDPDAGGISVNTKFGKDAKAMRASLRKDVEMGFHPTGCDTIRSVIDHEMGHEIDKLLGLANSQRYTDPELDRIMADYTLPEIGANLSRYAKKNPKEVIAEAWAEWKNNPQPREIATKIGRFLESKKAGKPTDDPEPQRPTHSVKLPKNPKRVSIDQATSALAQLGYSRSELPQFDFSTKKQIWTVVDPDGQVQRLDTDELTKIIYAGSDDPDTRAIKERGSKR